MNRFSEMKIFQAINAYLLISECYALFNSPTYKPVYGWGWGGVVCRLYGRFTRGYQTTRLPPF